MANKNIAIKGSKADVVFDIFNYSLMTIILLCVAYPLYFIVIASISDPTAVNSGEMLLYPISVTLEGYKRVMSYTTLWIGYKNTLIYTVLGTGINIILTMTLAYTLSRKTFSGRKVITIMLLIVMYFNGGLIPTFLVVKSLGLYNNWLVMIFLNAVNVFNVIIARTFLQNTIPEELYEAGVMDGCNHFTYFFKIIWPLSPAIMAVLTLYYGIGHWNDFMTGLIYLNDQALYPLQLVLRSILIQNATIEEMMINVEEAEKRAQLAEMLKYGVIIVSSVPVLMLYPFLQKYFVKGVMIGSVKG